MFLLTMSSSYKHTLASINNLSIHDIQYFDILSHALQIRKKQLKNDKQILELTKKQNALINEAKKSETKKSEKVSEPKKSETKKSEKVSEPKKSETKKSEKVSEPKKSETKKSEKVSEPKKSETKKSEKVSEPKKPSAYNNFQKWSKTSAGPSDAELEKSGGLRKWQSNQWKLLSKEQRENPKAKWNLI